MGLTQSKDPKGAVVLITGCSEGGIGYSLAEEFAARGCTVHATSRRLASMEGLKSKGIHTLEMDVTSPLSIEAAVNSVVQQSSHIDVLVNNAGIAELGPIADIPASTFQSVFNTNVTGVLILTQAVFPHMAKQHSGCILNIGSVAGTFYAPFGGAYHVSKAALDMLTHVMRVEMAPFGIKVVLIKPGFVKTLIIGKAHGTAQKNLNPSGWYAEWWRPTADALKMYSSTAMDVNKFAKKIADIPFQNRPQRLYVFNFPLFRLLRLLPQCLVDWMVLLPYRKLVSGG